MLKPHTPYWSPNPYRPLDEPRWEEQMAGRVRLRARELLRLHAAREIGWKEFINDRQWGMKMCLWQQHHKNDQRHKNLGRPFWSVSAYRAWVGNMASLDDGELLDRSGDFSLRTLQKPVKGKLRAFLRHEHVVPKNVMIEWLCREPDKLDAIFDKNICCVVTLDEDGRLDQNSHPDPTVPWKRYEGTGIAVLFNPDWPAEVCTELQQHGLLTEESYRPFGDKTDLYRAVGE